MKERIKWNKDDSIEVNDKTDKLRSGDENKWTGNDPGDDPIRDRNTHLGYLNVRRECEWIKMQMLVK